VRLWFTQSYEPQLCRIHLIRNKWIICEPETFIYEASKAQRLTSLFPLFLLCTSIHRQFFQVQFIIFYFKPIILLREVCHPMSIGQINHLHALYYAYYPNLCVLFFKVTQYNNVLLRSSILTNKSSIGCFRHYRA
jgi:hypothetical protein